MKYEAVIFDLDGLMIDSEKMCLDLLIEEGNIANVLITEEFYLQLIGSDYDTAIKLTEKYPKEMEVTRLTEHKRDGYFKEYFKTPGSCNKPGLYELSAFLKDNNYKIAIASSSNHKYINMVLGYLGFDFPVDVIVGKDDVTKVKPDPAIFNKAVEKLGVPKEKCIVLEDSKNGIIASSKAGISSIFIQDLVPSDELMESLYLCKLDSLHEVIEFLNSN